MSASGMHAHNVSDSLQEAANIRRMPATCMPYMWQAASGHDDQKLPKQALVE